MTNDNPTIQASPLALVKPLRPAAEATRNAILAHANELSNELSLSQEERQSMAEMAVAFKTTTVRHHQDVPAIEDLPDINWLADDVIAPAELLADCDNESPEDQREVIRFLEDRADDEGMPEAARAELRVLLQHYRGKWGIRYGELH